MARRRAASFGRGVVCVHVADVATGQQLASVPRRRAASPRGLSERGRRCPGGRTGCGALVPGPLSNRPRRQPGPSLRTPSPRFRAAAAVVSCEPFEGDGSDTRRGLARRRERREYRRRVRLARPRGADSRPRRGLGELGRGSGARRPRAARTSTLRAPSFPSALRRRHRTLIDIVRHGVSNGVDLASRFVGRCAPEIHETVAYWALKVHVQRV